MSGKLTRKERAKLQSEQHKTAQVTEAPVSRAKRVTSPNVRIKDNDLVRRLNIILIILAAAVYINSLGNQYALDDYGVIVDNQDTKTASVGKILSTTYRSGMLGGDASLYRPLSKVMFNLEWKLSPENPFLGHFMNVALFTLSISLLFKMLRRYMTGQVVVPFLATALFAVHPIHTEVIANIKGRDDILCFLFFIVTALYVHRYTLTSKTKYLVVSAFTFLLCMLSKESAITFVAVIPLMLYFFTSADKLKMLKVTGTVGGVAVLFLLIRLAVLHGSGFSPVPVVDNYIAGIDGFFEQRATAIAIGGIYLLKLVVPYELVCDASVAQMPVYGLGSWQFLLSFAVFAGAVVFALMKFTSKHPVSFAILYFLITFSIVSNIPFILGTNYGERLLYTPSLGICIILAWLVHKLFFAEENVTGSVSEFFRTHAKPVGAIAAIVVVYSAITIMRNPVWFDNETLYGTDAQISENSCKLHFFYANHLTLEENLKEFPKNSPEWTRRVDTAIIEFRKSISLYPGYGDAIQRLAEMHYNKSQFDSSEFYYELAIKTAPASAMYRSNYGRLLFDQQRYVEAEYQFKTATKLNAQYPEAYNNLAAVYGTMAGRYVNAAAIVTDSAESYRAKAMMYYNRSIQSSLNAIASNPNFVPAYETVAMTYGMIGDIAHQQEYAQAAQRLRAAGIEK